VTHVVFDLQYGGLERLVLALAARLAGTTTRVSVITLGPADRPLARQVAAHASEFHAHRSMRGLSMVAPLSLARRIRRTAPHVVHVHSGSWYKGGLAARLAGVPCVVYTEHGVVPGGHWMGWWLRRAAARLTDVFVAVSGAVQLQLAAEFPHTTARLICIENGTDTEFYSPGRHSSELARLLAIPDDAVVVGSVGRFEPVKGYETLLRAFAWMRERATAGSRAYLVLCGSGSEGPTLRALATELGVSAYVRWPGLVEPLEYYRLFDIFALTSYSEGIPLSLLEAMACGVPPVVSDVGANAEVVGPDLRAHVVAARDVTGTATVLDTLCRSAGARRKAGELARNRVVARYNLDRMVAAYVDVYRGGSGSEGREAAVERPRITSSPKW